MSALWRNRYSVLNECFPDQGAWKITIRRRRERVMSLPHNNEEMLNGFRVLVVDDCMVVRELMSLTLTPMGAEVDVAGSGEDALRVPE